MHESKQPARRERERDQAVRTFVDTLGSAMFESGLPRMPSRVFAALLATDSGQRSAAELAQMLSVSPAAISGAVRYLIQIGLVTRKREAGSRRDQFVLHSDVWYEIMMQDMAGLKGWETGFEVGLDAVGSDTPAGRRLAESLAFFHFVREEMPAMIERWHERRRTLFD
ncbi:MAG: GbsR/MarR family transcriptional regulator [Nocardioidaceae bacterium]